MPPPCFTPGSRCAAPGGDVLVEDVRVGDVLLVQSGSRLVARPVVWVGSGSVAPTKFSCPELSAPIRIDSSALADGVPKRDLSISPDHRILLNGRLVPARLLVNGMSIRRELFNGPVTYLHIEFAEHSILFVEGVPAESFLDEQNDRSFFEAGSAVTALRPTLPNLNDPAHSPRACAPLAMTPAASRDIWQMLYDRAIALGYPEPALTTVADPGLHLVADGAPVMPVHCTATEASFVLPAAPTTLRLASRASSPSALDRDADDWRILGVAVRELRYRTQTGETVYGPDHPALSEGWQDAESDASGSWRWTRGNARLPCPTAAATITVRFFAQPAYLIDTPAAAETRRAA
ncbi:MAG: Hint domain-containing protein [Acetobacteraceae bacterium]